MALLDDPVDAPTGAWITVADAALLVGRSPATIYNWIRAGRLHTAVGAGSVTLVHGPSVLAAEAKVRRGRPPGSASSRWWRSA